MIILHGTVIDNLMYVWAEDSESPFAIERPAITPNDSPSTDNGDACQDVLSENPDSFASRAVSGPVDEAPCSIGGHGSPNVASGGDKDSTDKVVRHQAEDETELGYLPFGCSSKTLRATLMSAVPFLRIAKSQNSQLVVTVPATASGCPFPSSRMIADFPEDEGAPITNSRWLVCAIRLTWQQAIDLLCYCTNKPLLAEGLKAGVDLEQWNRALLFSYSLVSRQQFLPCLDDTINGIARSTWQPIIAGDDARRFMELANNLPASCFSLSLTTKLPRASVASELLTIFVRRILNHLLRSSEVCISPLNRSGAVDFESSDSEAPSSPSVHSRWLQSLLSHDEAFKASEKELDELRHALDSWKRPLSCLTDIPYRLCFKFEEAVPFVAIENNDDAGPTKFDGQEADPSRLQPAQPYKHAGNDYTSEAISKAENQRWFVRYVFQSLDEAHRQFTPAQFLKSGHTLLGKKATFAYEFVFSALGYASKICPWLLRDDSIEKIPTGFYLDNNEGYEFLSNIAPSLRNLGFGVQLPAWWLNRKPPIKATMHFDDQSTGLFGLESLSQFDWNLAIGGGNLRLDDIEEMIRRNLRLIQFGESWFELNPDHLVKVLKFFRQQTDQKLPIGNLIKMGLGDVSLPGGVDFGGVSGTGRTVDLISQLQGNKEVEPLTPHRNFAGRLRPYQTKGMSWLGFLDKCRLGACLADDMGLGKTVQTLSYIQLRWLTAGKSERRPTLLVCPMSVLNNWQAEAAKFTPDLPCFIHHGSDRERDAGLRALAQKSALVITSYALLVKDLEDFKKIEWGMVVLDEAQNIKNPETKQAQAAFSLQCDFRVALTGTPVENGVGDLWSIMNFLNPGYLGNRAEFKRNFYLPIQAGEDQEISAKLRKLTAPFILRRLKTDKSIIDDLPSKQEFKVQCNLTKEQASLYATVVAEIAGVLEKLKGIERSGVVLVAMTKLKQICNHPSTFLKDRGRVSGRSGKLARLVERVEAIVANGERALVFTQFREMGNIIQSHLQNVLGSEVAFLHGQLDRRQREVIVQRFQNEKDGPKILVLSLKAAGTGLTLTRATQVIHFDRWWNPAVEEQATDRAYRIGQTREVQVHKFICSGTLEEKIDQMLENKKLIAAQTVGTSESWITELSTEELKDLFALRQTVLAE